MRSTNRDTSEILAVTDAKTCRHQFERRFLMIPRKSVTAIIGLFTDEKLARPRRKKIACGDCSMNKNCEYRR